MLAPALSSSPRPKEHTKGQAQRRQYPSGDSFAINEVLLLLNCLAENALHAARVLLETATREGWSIRRLRERVLRVAARVLLHSRRVVIVIGKAAAALWEALTAGLMQLSWAGPYRPRPEGDEHACQSSADGLSYPQSVWASDQASRSPSSVGSGPPPRASKTLAPPLDPASATGGRIGGERRGRQPGGMNNVG